MTVWEDTPVVEVPRTSTTPSTCGSTRTWMPPRDSRTNRTPPFLHALAALRRPAPMGRANCSAIVQRGAPRYFIDGVPDALANVAIRATTHSVVRQATSKSLSDISNTYRFKCLFGGKSSVHREGHARHIAGFF